MNLQALLKTQIQSRKQISNFDDRFPRFRHFRSSLVLFFGLPLTGRVKDDVGLAQRPVAGC